MSESVKNESRTRAPEEVLKDHLHLGKHGTVEEDLSRNYAEDVVMLTSFGIYRGHDGVRQLAERLREEVPEATFEYHTVEIEEEVGFLEWSAESPEATIDDGADSFVIRGGQIVAQTIHYTVEPRAD